MMPHFGYSIVLTIAGVCGGLFLTLLSGLYIVKPLVMDAEIIYYGFPAIWLEAGRSTWIPKPPQSWQFYFLWYGFVSDFILFGLLTTAAVYFYIWFGSRRIIRHRNRHSSHRHLVPGVLI